MKVVDARGRSCPEPLVMVKQAAKETNEPFQVLVDNVCSVENVKRFAGMNNYSVEQKEEGDEFCLTLTKK
jgi:tRNA 2-thiouridine synthesizing protein A